MDGWSACDMKAHHHNGVRHDARKKNQAARALRRQLYAVAQDARRTNRSRAHAGDFGSSAHAENCGRGPC
jgi:acyl-CoA synthetase (NDP forming)